MMTLHTMLLHKDVNQTLLWKLSWNRYYLKFKFYVASPPGMSWLKLYNWTVLSLEIVRYVHQIL